MRMYGRGSGCPQPCYSLLDYELGRLAGQGGEKMNERVYHVLEDLLDIDHLASEPARNALRPAAVQDLLLEAMEGLEMVFLDRGIDLRVHLPEGVPPVLGDPARLQLVFQNLLTNALRYTGEGGKVYIAVHPKGDMVRVTVEDTGVGIPPEYLPHIFEKFFRVPGQDHFGLGLGLTIARNIVAAHGGNIEVASQFGKGTRFSFTLKAAAPFKHQY
jgi:signal transduction histidine kinase